VAFTAAEDTEHWTEELLQDRIDYLLVSKENPSIKSLTVPRMCTKEVVTRMQLDSAFLSCQILLKCTTEMHHRQQ
jgi:hypothetical protein